MVVLLQYFIVSHATKSVYTPPPPCLAFYSLGNRAQSKLQSFGELEGNDEDSEEGKRNNILQKAILLYIGFVSPIPSLQVGLPVHKNKAFVPLFQVHFSAPIQQSRLYLHVMLIRSLQQCTLQKYSFAATNEPAKQQTTSSCPLVMYVFSTT